MTVSLLLTIAACVLAAALAGIGFYFLGRATGARRARGLEARLARVEKSGASDLVERLRVVEQRIGVVYLDGLAFCQDAEMVRQFKAGLAHAEQGRWEPALADWDKARARASGAEAVALAFVCGCCLAFLDRTDQARVLLQNGLGIATRAGDRTGTASIRLLLGRLEQRAGRLAQARHHFTVSARFWHELGAAVEEGRVLVRLAEVEEKSGEVEASLGFRRQALRLMERVGDDAGAAAQYGAIGNALAGSGDLDKARAAHEDGLHVARESGNRLAEAERLASIGEIHLVQGSAKRALDVLERALRAFQDERDAPAEARVLYQLALAHRALEEWDVAHEYFERSLAASREAGDRILQARNLAALAEGSMVYGAYDDARQSLAEALKQARAAEDEGELARLLVSHARVLGLEGEHEAAEGELREARALAQKTGAVRTAVLAGVEAARVASAKGRHEEALAMLGQCSSQAKALGSREVDAEVRSELGAVQLRLGRPERAREELRAAVEASRTSGQKRELGLALVYLGLASVRLGDHESGLRDAEDGLQQLHSYGRLQDEIWALRQLSEMNRQARRLRPARQNLERALELARRGHDERLQVDCLFELGRLLAAAGQHEEARTLLGQAARFYTRLGDPAAARAAAEELSRLPGTATGVQIVGDENGGG